MGEYIDRDAFRKKLLSFTYLGEGDYYNGKEDERDSIVECLNEQPAADVAEVRRGHWIVEPGKIPRCSECNEYSDDGYNGAMICPWCGARMEALHEV